MSPYPSRATGGPSQLCSSFRYPKYYSCASLHYLTMADDGIYSGPWQLYYEPWHRRWIFTTTNFNVFIILGLYAVLMTITQQRLWILLRLLCIRLTQPVHLDDDDDLNSIVHISQGSAASAGLKRLILSARLPARLRHEISSRRQGTRPIPLSLSLLALWNGFAFLTLGFVIPWSLTSSIEDPSVVKLSHSGCLPRDDARTAESPYNLRMRAQATYENCYDLSSEASMCPRDINRNLDMHLRMVDKCPLPNGLICDNRTQALKLYVRNISPRNLGINLKLPVIFEHQLVCSPIILDSALKIDQSDVVFWGYDQENGCHPPEGPRLESPVRNNDLPNVFSDDHCGHTPFARRDSYQLLIFSWAYITKGQDGSCHLPKDPRLPHGSALSSQFIVLRKPGQIVYPQRVDDPFFSATTPWVLFPNTSNAKTNQPPPFSTSRIMK